MKKNLILIPLVLVAIVFAFYAFKEDQPVVNNKINFATEGMYPPFISLKKGVLIGFDIDLGNMIAAELGKEAVFHDMQFSSIMPSLESGKTDAAMAAITITEDRRETFDFSIPYHFDDLALVYREDEPVTNEHDVVGKKIACQIGTTMETWAKQHATQQDIIIVDNNNQAIEMLKAKQVDTVVINFSQASVYSKKNPGLAFNVLGKSEEGIGVVLQKNSPLTADVNKAITSLKAKGKLDELAKKWISSTED